MGHLLVWRRDGFGSADATSVAIPRPHFDPGLDLRLMVGARGAITRRPVSRLRLGSELQATPLGRYETKDIEAIHFASDPDEDYVDKDLPIPLCQLTVNTRKKFSFRLVVSLGDAQRVREWADRIGVVVIDPEGYSRKNNSPEVH